MDYYEELGLRPSATDEDIRRAFRTVSKVLHPDLQVDPAAREAAALQMRRLNAIVDVLLDPRRRQEYDRTLYSVSVPPVIVPVRVPPYRPPGREPGSLVRWLRIPGVGVALTIVAGVLLTLAVVWFEAGDLIHFQMSPERTVAPEQSSAHASDTQPHSPMRAPPAKAGVDEITAPPPGTSVAPSRSGRRSTPPVPAPTPEKSASVRATPPSSPSVTAHAPAGPVPQPVPHDSPVASSVYSAPAPTAPAPPRATAPAPAPPPGLDGLWVYAPEAPAGQRSSTLYAPEFIQLRIHAQDDKLYGEYSARYFVADRPISSNVSFTFQGKAGTSGSFGWRAEDGSLGIVDLKMINAQSLQVNWRVTSFGSRIGLGAGTAVLIRRLQS